MATPFPFGSGNTLLASQLNAITTLPTSTKTASHTLTIADVSTRVIMNSASATTITVNTSIFGASDVVEILNIGAGVCTVTAGTCTVGTSGTLALVQNAGGTLTFISASASVFRANAVAATASGLVYITGATFTTQSTVSMAASTFTATYKNYIVYLDITSVSAQLQVSVRVNNAGTPRTAASYFWGTGVMSTAGTFVGTGSGSSSTPQIVGADGTRGYHGQINVFDPTNASSYTEVTAAGNGNVGGTNGAIFGGYFYNATEANDGLTFVTSTGTMTGFYRVYGLSES